MFSSGPPGLRLDDADQPVATASGVRAGRYTFRLTVSDQEGATDSASLTVKVPEGELCYSWKAELFLSDSFKSQTR